MSRVYETTRDGKIQMFRDALAQARAQGDAGMVRNCRLELAALETTRDDSPLEQAVPGKPRRGRRPKPRCEHGLIAERCEVCNEDEVA